MDKTTRTVGYGRPMSSHPEVCDDSPATEMPGDVAALANSLAGQLAQANEAVARMRGRLVGVGGLSPEGAKGPGTTIGTLQGNVAAAGRLLHDLADLENTLGG